MRTLFVFLVCLVFAPSMASAQSKEFVLEKGQTVSEIVFQQLRQASLWKSVDVEVMHPKREVSYAKTNFRMRHLPVGTRIRISEKLIAARKPVLPPVPVAVTTNPVAPTVKPVVPPPPPLPAKVVPVPWYVPVTSTDFVLLGIAALVLFLLGVALGMVIESRRTKVVIDIPGN